MSTPLPRALCEAFQRTTAVQPDTIALRELGDNGILTLAEVEAAPAPGFEFEESWHAVDA